MITIYWLDITDYTVIRLSLSGKVIYSASVDDINTKIDPSDLKGRIISPLSRDVIQIAHWVIYETLKGEVRIAPVYDDLVEQVKQKRHLFQSPIDIRVLYDILSL